MEEVYPKDRWTVQSYQKEKEKQGMFQSSTVGLSLCNVDKSYICTYFISCIIILYTIYSNLVYTVINSVFNLFNNCMYNMLQINDIMYNMYM